MDTPTQTWDRDRFSNELRWFGGILQQMVIVETFEVGDMHDVLANRIEWRDVRQVDNIQEESSARR